MNKEEVLRLAKLSRIDISSAEAESLSHEFDSILKYVGEIKNANTNTKDAALSSVRNVLRDDDNAHESGLYTKAMLSEAPKTEGDYVKVKKIL